MDNLIGHGGTCLEKGDTRLALGTGTGLARTWATATAESARLRNSNGDIGWKPKAFSECDELVSMGLEKIDGEWNDLISGSVKSFMV
jgi:hypothetical protein